MFPAESLWLCIAVPALLVMVLIFIKFVQQRINKQTENQSGRNGILTRKMSQPELVVRRERPEPMKNNQQAERKHDNSDKPDNCQRYLGYLYMRQGSERNQIPTECYDCRKLLQCMYSPNVIERVYGQ